MCKKIYLFLLFYPSRVLIFESRKGERNKDGRKGKIRLNKIDRGYLISANRHELQPRYLIRENHARACHHRFPRPAFPPVERVREQRRLSTHSRSIPTIQSSPPLTETMPPLSSFSRHSTDESTDQKKGGRGEEAKGRKKKYSEQCCSVNSRSWIGSSFAYLGAIVRPLFLGYSVEKWIEFPPWRATLSFAAAVNRLSSLTEGRIAERWCNAACAGNARSPVSRFSSPPRAPPRSGRWRSATRWSRARTTS